MRRFWLEIQISSIFTATIVYIIGKSIEGIIGNGASDIFRFILKAALHIVLTNPLLGFLGIFCALMCSPVIQDRKEKIIQAQQKEIEVRLDGNKKRQTLAKILMGREYFEENLQNFVRSLLLDITREMSTRPRKVTLYVPDKSGEYLMKWVRIEYRNEEGDTMKEHDQFYIGKGEKRRGIAGEAYYQKKPLSIRLDKKKQCWEVNDHQLKKCYIPYEGQEEGIPPLYQSILCWPVIDGDDCLGVVCFDSVDADAFSSLNTNVRFLLEWLDMQITFLLHSRVAYEEKLQEADELEKGKNISYKKKWFPLNKRIKMKK